MSRIRSIHPGLWTDEAFVSLSPMARLLLMGIWNECDDMGSFAWAPLTLKMRVLPADNTDAAELMSEMTTAGIIVRYDAAGKAYGAVRNFCQFQRPKKPNSTHPQTDEVREWVNVNARTIRDGEEAVPNRLPTEQEKPRQMEDGGWVKEDCSDEQSSPRKRGNDGKSLISTDWKAPPLSELPPRSRACAEQWTDASYQTEAEAFLLYWRSERKMKANWRDTWANRIIARHSAVMRDQKFGNAPTDAAKLSTPAEQIANLKKSIEFFTRVGRDDDVRECRRRIAALEGQQASPVARLVQQAARNLAA